MKILRNFCLATLAAMSVSIQAQTWSFDSSEWGISCGTADINSSSNTIKSSSYQWGCLGIKYRGTKTVKTSSHNLVITGKNLQTGTSNPNIDKFCVGKDSVSVLASQQKGATVNSKNTLIAFNVSSLLGGASSNNYESDGTIQIRYINIYLQEAKINDEDVNITIDNVQFLTDQELASLQDSLNNIVTNEYTWKASDWLSGEYGTIIPDASANAINVDTYDQTNGAYLYYGDATGNKDFTISSGNKYLFIKGQHLGKTSLAFMNIGGMEAFSDPIEGELNKDSTRVAFNLTDVFDAAKDNISEGLLHFRELIISTMPSTSKEHAYIKSIDFITPVLYNKIMADENAKDFTFNAPDWNQTCGTIAVDTTANNITALSYAWGCVGIEYNGSSLISKTKPYIVLTGKNLWPGSSNPNIYTLSLNETKTSASGLKMTVNADSTLLYYNLSDILTANDSLKRTDNTFVMNKIGMYLQLPLSNSGDSLNIVIDNMKFMNYTELQTLLGINTTPDFTFKATNWTQTCGNVNTDENTNVITASAYQWGCAGIINKATTYNISVDKPYLVLSGTNLQQGTSNPCVYSFAVAGTDMLGGGKPMMTSLMDSTICYVDMSYYINKAVEEGLNVGSKLALTSMGFYLQEAKNASGTDENLTVTDMKFMSKEELLTLYPTLGINSVTTRNMKNENVYNLNGQIVKENASSVEGLNKGIYILNGKKIVK